MNSINISNSAGAFTLGDGSGTNNLTLGGTAGTHTWVNNSANVATINSDVIWTMGGGQAHILAFDGSGDWAVNKYLPPSSGSGGASLAVVKNGAGTLALSKGGTLGAGGAGSITINGGTVSLRSDSVVAAQAIIANATLEAKSPLQPITLTGVISGTGTLAVASGTLTLSGNNSFSGLTVVSNAGTLVAGGSRALGVTLAVMGAVDLAGFAPTVKSLSGTGMVSNSVASLATLAVSNSSPSVFGGTIADGGAGQTVALTKDGPSTLTLAGTSSYTGITMVNAGTLLFQTPLSGGGDLMVADSAALAVAGTQLSVNNLTLGTGAGANLDFYGVSSTSTVPITATNLASSGTLIVNINSGSFTVGQSYPLLTWIGGSAPTASIGILNGASGNLSVTNNTLYLNIAGISYVWSGANNGNWDTTTANNWKVGGSSVTYVDGGSTLFNDTASGTTAVTVNALVSPAAILVDNTSKAYSISASPGKLIGGSAAMVKSGGGTLTLSGGVNTYSGATTIGGGTVSVGMLANGGTASDIGASDNTQASLVLNGGTLKYTGAAASIDRQFTVGLANGTIDVSGSGALGLTNSASVGLGGLGARTLTLTGTNSGDNLLAATLADNGGATSLVKGGPGKWILSGANSHSGGTTLSSGMIQMGSDSALGSGPLVVNGDLDLAGFNPVVGTFSGSGIISNSAVSTVTLTAGGNSAGTFSGTIQDGGAGKVVALNKVGFSSLTLTGTNTYSGGTTISAGSLQLGNGGTSGTIVDAPLLNDGSLIINHSDNVTLSSVIGGSGSIQHNGTGVLTLLGVNTFSGGVTVNGTAATLSIGNDSALGTTPGRLTLTAATDTVQSSDATPRTIALDVALSYGSGNYIFGSPGSGNLELTGTFLTGNNPKSVTISNSVTIISGSVTDNGAPTGPFSKSGPGTLVLSNPANSTTKQLAIIQGEVVLSGSWSGPVQVNSNATLSGTGSAAGPSVTVSPGGRLVPGSVSSVGTFTVGGDLTNSGDFVVSLNKSLSQSNSIVSVVGNINLANSTLIVSNLGPALVVGDAFTLLSHPAADITGMKLVAPVGFRLANNLATDGSISVTGIIPTAPTNLTATVSGSQLVLSWPADYTGWHLQSQTNSAAAGISTNWVTIPGTDLGYSYTNNINPANGSVLFRMVYP